LVKISPSLALNDINYPINMGPFWGFGLALFGIYLYSGIFFTLLGFGLALEFALIYYRYYAQLDKQPRTKDYHIYVR
jgi:hypothetical protein